MSSHKVTIYRQDYQQPSHWIKNVDLAFMVEADHTLVKARIQFERNHSVPFDGRLFLNGVDLQLEQIGINGKKCQSGEYELVADGLWLNQTPDQFELQTKVRIFPAQNTALEGLYQSGEFFLTQCEAEGFRKITYYLDRPDVLAPFTVTIVADESRYPVLLSNGNPLSAGKLGSGRHYSKWMDPHPKPSYLFALVAGDLGVLTDHYTTSEGRQVTLNIYTESQNLNACDFAMASLKNSMKWDEERFGLPYDLDVYNIVATDDFNMGAMENKGLNIFNSKYVLAKPDTATDHDFINVEAVIGHEYFHNWTGNRVTCKDWFQLSLKEGLTVFRDQEFTSDRQSRAVKRIEDVRHLRAAQFAEDASPMSHSVRPDSYIEINNFYTLTVYEKGSEVVRMYHTLLGEAGFQKGMSLYFERHDGQAVSCNDFRLAMADANGVNLDQFELWYAQNGTPEVLVTEKYDGSKNSLTLVFEQHAPANYSGDTAWQAMQIPIRMAVYDQEGTPLALNAEGQTQMVYELTEKSQTLVLEDIAAKPVASLLQGFSAPVNLARELSPQQLTVLMAHDQDPFNRWDAAQQMQAQVIKARYQALLDGENYGCPPSLLSALRLVLLDPNTDPALIAEALTLPSLKSLILQLSDVDVLLLHEAKEWLVQHILKHLQVELLSVYHQHNVPEDYAVESSQVAKRSLKNRCLWYLLQGGQKEMANLAFEQQKSANNYTDKITALSLLTHQQVEGFEDLLGEYFTTWRDHPLVINKWLSIQATIPAEDTLERVKQLMELPVFSMKNPNAVRSLIGSFCAANITGFHASDGSGYAFLADQVISLDVMNPQVAARMVSLFNDFQMFKVETQQQMLDQIKRIHSHKPLSSNVFEIVDRALKQGLEQS